MLVLPLLCCLALNFVTKPALHIINTAPQDMSTVQQAKRVNVL